MKRDEVPRNRNSRHREVRAKVESPDRVPKYRLRMIAEENRLSEHLPRMDGLTRGECQGGHRPCPMVSCRHNLYLDVNPKTGTLKRNFPDLEPWEVDPARSCALDVADLGGAALEDVAIAMNVTRERVRQIETMAIARIERDPEGLDVLRQLAGLPDDYEHAFVVEPPRPGMRLCQQGLMGRAGRGAGRVHADAFVPKAERDSEDADAEQAPEPEPAEVPAWRKRMMELEAPREYPPRKSDRRLSLDTFTVEDVIRAEEFLERNNRPNEAGFYIRPHPANAALVARIVEESTLAVVHKAYVVPDPPKPTPEEARLSNELYPVIVECPWFEVVEERAERKRARKATKATKARAEKAARGRWRLVDGRATYCRRAG